MGGGARPPAPPGGGGGGGGGGRAPARHLMLSRGVTNEFLWWPLHASKGLWNTSSDIIRLVIYIGTRTRSAMLEVSPAQICHRHHMGF
jgi:hypothetical protein